MSEQEKPVMCTFCPEDDQHPVGRDFFGEPCSIDGVQCCEVCAIVHETAQEVQA